MNKIVYTNLTFEIINCYELPGNYKRLIDAKNLKQLINNYKKVKKEFKNYRIDIIFNEFCSHCKNEKEIRLPANIKNLRKFYKNSIKKLNE